MRGSYNEIDTETGNLKYETQEYIDNSSIELNGKLSVARTLSIESTLTSSNGVIPVFTNVNVGANAKVSAAALTMADGKLFIAKNSGTDANLAVSGATNITKGTVDVAGKFTAGNVVLSSATADAANVVNFTIEKDAVVETTGGFEVNYTSNLVVNGTLNVAGYLNLSKNSTGTLGAGFTIGEGASITTSKFRSGFAKVVLAKNSSLIVKNSSTENAWLSAGTNGNLVANEGSYLEISARGEVNMYNGITMDGNFKFDVGMLFYCSTITVNTTGNSFKANLALNSNSRLTVNAANDFSGLRVMSYAKIANVDVNADTTIDSFAFSAGSTINVTLANNSVLKLATLSSAYNGTYGELGEGDLLLFKNFDNGQVVLINHTDKDDDLLQFVRINSASDDSQLAWIFNSADNGWHLTVVPEPATYATIFGALAIALAVWRRRK